MDKVSSAGNLPNEGYKKAAESDKKTSKDTINKKNETKTKDSETGEETKSATKDKKKSA